MYGENPESDTRQKIGADEHHRFPKRAAREAPLGFGIQETQPETRIRELAGRHVPVFHGQIRMPSGSKLVHVCKQSD